MGSLPELEINISDILTILGDAKRPLVESLAVFLADHIILCGYKSRDTTKIDIDSFVVQSSSIHDVPHEINIKLLVSERKKFILSTYSCPAGAGSKCKYIFATLLNIHQLRIVNLSQVSCTDLRQQWGKLKKNYELPYDKILPIEEYCHFQKFDSQPKYAVNDDLKRFFFETMNSASPNSESAMHISRVRQTKQCMKIVVQNNQQSIELVNNLLQNQAIDFILSSLPNYVISSDFYENVVEVSNKKAVDLFIGTINQMNDLWKKERKMRITGSICYELFTYCSNKNPDWEKKVLKVFFSSFEGNSDTEYGIENESTAMKLYEKQLGVKTEKCGLFVNPKASWIGYSGDGINVDQKSLCEIKCPIVDKTMTATDSLKHVSFLTCKSDGKIIFKNRHKYYGQIQLGMMFFGLPKCHFIVYASYDDSIAVLEIPYDQVFVLEMVSVLHSAYFNNILPILESIQM